MSFSFWVLIGLLVYLLVNMPRFLKFRNWEKGYFFLILLLFLTIVVLRYPSRGIDFEIDRFSERITAIIIYMPVERPRLPESKYRQYREQFKQMK